nr:MAG TPA: hypothetical protein [Caudoviricetes sp.]
MVKAFFVFGLQAYIFFERISIYIIIISALI